MVNLERKTRVELATPAALRAVLCLGSIGLALIVNPLRLDPLGDCINTVRFGHAEHIFGERCSCRLDPRTMCKWEEPVNA